MMTKLQKLTNIYSSHYVTFDDKCMHVSIVRDKVIVTNVVHGSGKEFSISNHDKLCY